jgi:intracellular multiplication protein IcmD
MFKDKGRLVTLGLGSLTLLLLSTGVMAASGQTLASLGSNIVTQANAIAKLMAVAAYVAGVGFALAGVLQFKAHKDNPQQTPLSKPVVYIVVAAALLFLPTVMSVAGSSVFGSGNKASAYTGELGS